jgi:hypothetical protein
VLSTLVGDLNEARKAHLTARDTPIEVGMLDDPDEDGQSLVSAPWGWKCYCVYDFLCYVSNALNLSLVFDCWSPKKNLGLVLIYGL